MSGLMQQVLGAAWEQLPPALQAHHRAGPGRDIGQLDIAYPGFMQPFLCVLTRLGALVHRRAQAVPTRVQRRMVGQRLHWRRRLRFADGRLLRFDSVWELGPQGHLVEYVNPWLGLLMRASVVGGELHLRGVHFIVRLGRWALPVPEWLALGHTDIVERAVDAEHFAMDFRMTHPLWGQLYRYTGTFKTVPVA